MSKMDFLSANSRFAVQKHGGDVKTRKPKQDLIEITFLAELNTWQSVLGAI